VCRVDNAERDDRGEAMSWLDDLTKKEEQKLIELLRQRVSRARRRSPPRQGLTAPAWTGKRSSTS
jgi:hypothetical protein